MAQYKVRSGQNIYDVALTLYGSIEGIFDLLASNTWLDINTKLSYRMVLEYNEEFITNKNIVIWLKENNVLVKNGEHVQYYLDIEELTTNHITSEHPELLASLSELSADEQSMFWESLQTPRMIILQHGYLSTIKATFSPHTHFIIDWGDYSEPQIFEGTEEFIIEHCYKGNETHTITLYGDFECSKLDFTELNGVYYPLGYIYANEFTSALENQSLQKLIIPQ